ncbi:MAG: ferrienterochelin and colicins outer membrane receptor [bacterium]|nr:MAG: ferrienterochelin and colicins outer membrane receptor [bacterium]
MTKIIHKVFLCLFITLSIKSIYAQGGATTVNITGNITDEQDAAITGAIITAKNVNTNFVREISSQEDGSFNIVQLPPGNYEITISAAGFSKQMFVRDLALGTTSLFNFKLKLGESSEIIEVFADAGVSTSKTESSTNISQDSINNLPINRRNFLDFTLTSARATPDRVPAQGTAPSSGISFNALPARFNNITIDGVDNNDVITGTSRTTFSQEAVQEFQVVSDSYSAEFGRAVGGAINIITKTGSNQFHNNTFFFLRNDSTSARDTFAAKEPPYEQYQFGSALSGPIKQDKAFFFTSFERLSIKQSNIVTIADNTVAALRRQNFLSIRNGAIPLGVGTTTVLVRADAKITPNNVFWVRYNGGFNYNGAFESFGGLTAETNGGILRQKDNSIAASNTYINTSLNFVNETRVLYGRRNTKLISLDTNKGPLLALVAPEGSINLGRNQVLDQDRSEKSYQFVNNTSLTRGRNEIRFGVDFSYLDMTGQLPFFFGGQALFGPLPISPNVAALSGLQALDPTLRSPEQIQVLNTISPGLASLPIPRTFLQGFGNDGLITYARFISLFVQDKIKVKPNLILNAGVRFDTNQVGYTPRNSGIFSPRLGLSYRIKEKLRFSLSYGIFSGVPLVGVLGAAQVSGDRVKIVVLPFPLSVAAFAQPNRRFPNNGTIPSQLNFVPQLSQEINVDPNLQDSYSQQVTGTLDYAFDSKTFLSVSYNFSQVVKLFGVRQINPIIRPVPGNAVQSAVLGRVDPTTGGVFEYASAFNSNYNAVTFQFERKFDKRFSLLAHYTFSKAIDDSLDFRTIVQETQNPLQIGNERALSVQDLRSRFVASGVYDLSYLKNRIIGNMQISTIINVNSGRPYNLLAGMDLNLNGDNPPGDRPNGIGRNAGITPGFANIDFRLSRKLTIKENFQLQGYVEFFNLFNRVNINEVARIFPPDAQGRFNLPKQEKGRFIVPKNNFRSAFAPRQIQIGLRMTF